MMHQKYRNLKLGFQGRVEGQIDQWTGISSLRCTQQLFRVKFASLISDRVE